jgi:hypothetical protein
MSRIGRPRSLGSSSSTLLASSLLTVLSSSLTETSSSLPDFSSSSAVSYSSMVACRRSRVSRSSCSRPAASPSAGRGCGCATSSRDSGRPRSVKTIRYSRSWSPWMNGWTVIRHELYALVQLHLDALADDGMTLGDRLAQHRAQLQPQLAARHRLDLPARRSHLRLQVFVGRATGRIPGYPFVVLHPAATSNASTSRACWASRNTHGDGHNARNCTNRARSNRRAMRRRCASCINDDAWYSTSRTSSPLRPRTWIGRRALRIRAGFERAMW